MAARADAKLYFVVHSRICNFWAAEPLSASEDLFFMELVLGTSQRADQRFAIAPAKSVLAFYCFNFCLRLFTKLNVFTPKCVPYWTATVPSRIFFLFYGLTDAIHWQPPHGAAQLPCNIWTYKFSLLVFICDQMCTDFSLTQNYNYLIYFLQIHRRNVCLEPLTLCLLPTNAVQTTHWNGTLPYVIGPTQPPIQ